MTTWTPRSCFSLLTCVLKESWTAKVSHHLVCWQSGIPGPRAAAVWHQSFADIYIYIYDPGLAGPTPTPTQCNVPILTPFPPPPCGCGLWFFLWVGNVALVLALPHNDRCGVIRGSQFRGTWMGQTKWIIISHIWFQWSRLKVSPPHSMRGTWIGKTLMIIILPIRLDGVGFLLWHENVFQTPNVPACNSIFCFCQLTFKATRRPPYSHWSNG